MENNKLCEQEFSSLRTELLESKKYVFERPLLIVGIGMAGIKILDTPYLSFLPFVLSGLLLYNFWFTTNRLMSAARIVAYIQLEHEEKKYGQWIGWETSLRYYRKWLNIDSEQKKLQIQSEMDKDAMPDAMMFYPPIYQLHTILIVFMTIAALLITVIRFSTINGFCAIGTLITLAKFLPYYRRYTPEWATTLTEKNRIIWSHVFEYMIIEKVKNKAEKSALSIGQV